jgi:hypothetical protein
VSARGKLRSDPAGQEAFGILDLYFRLLTSL